MKKIILPFVIILVLIVMTACSPDNFNFKVENIPTYIAGEKTEVILAAYNDKDLVKGLQIIGEMDTASEETIELTFTNNEDGTYTGHANLPNSGYWVMLLKVKNGEKESEYLVKLKVTEE